VPSLPFRPTAEVALILDALLDSFERRTATRRAAASDAGGDDPGSRVIRYRLEPNSARGYFSQADPAPRQAANEQLQRLERAGWVKLEWLPGETGHLLSGVTLLPAQAEAVFQWLEREPQASRRARLADLLLGDRFRFTGWRRRAVEHVLGQLKAEKSAAPFSLSDEEFNRDLLTALAALDQVREETPYRVFSVRVFNDSKRFEALTRAVVALARRGQPDWGTLSGAEVLGELNLVTNPGHLYLHGAWNLTDALGQPLPVEGFQPSVGFPAAQVNSLRRVVVAEGAGRQVIAVENPTTFYELVRHQPEVVAICLWGNPSPACRHLLRQLPASVGLSVWADLDYGGFNILAQLREQVSASAVPFHMDIDTFEAHARWARPLSAGDVKNLSRLLRRASLADVQPVIRHLLERGLKLEQEAIVL
jgi:hypothetical protein